MGGPATAPSRRPGFYPGALKKGSRTEQALRLALAEMYVQGVFTRKVIEVLQRLVGPEVSIFSPKACPREGGGQSCRAAARRGAGAAGARSRWVLHPTCCSTRGCERVREAGQLVDCAVLVAVGITETGHRRVLGVSVALSEAEVHWRAFLEELVKRGLTGVKLIVADDHAGLKAARRAVLPAVPWQRCQFHLQQNAQAYVTRLEQREPIARRIRAIFNAPERAEAQRLLAEAVALWRSEAPKLADWAEAKLPDGFAVFDDPQAHRVRRRTANALERVNRELKRRTRVASLFPNAASCLRLVSALLTEFDEEWMSGKIYLTMKP